MVQAAIVTSRNANGRTAVETLRERELFPAVSEFRGSWEIWNGLKLSNTSELLLSVPKNSLVVLSKVISKQVVNLKRIRRRQQRLRRQWPQRKQRNSKGKLKR